MKKLSVAFLLTVSSQFCVINLFAQNVGIGNSTPAGKLHIKGSADAPQLIIDANSTQSNSNPLIKLRRNGGTDLLWIHSDYPDNTFIGLNAGRVNDAGSGGLFNTFTGGAAGYSNTNGGNNTANGSGALYNNTTANENVAIGSGALAFQSFNNSNNPWISANTAVGYQALLSNQPTTISLGIKNTAVGHSALRANTIGYHNTAIGMEALYSNTGGIDNTANGSNALYSNTFGSFNAAYGSNALKFNSTGYSNTAHGMSALQTNTTASENTAIGRSALFNHSFNNGGTAWSSANTAVGYEALYSNAPTSTTSGINNTAVGHSALRANNTGWGNTAVGVASLRINQTGHSNSAYGYEALYSNSEGSYNTALGRFALFSNISGGDNVAIGWGAGNDLNNRSNNTVIGSAAHVGLASNNCVAIGSNSFTNVSNVALLGNTTNGPVGGYSNWTNFSDGRFKTGIQENVKGLDFIMRLRPVTYHMNVRGLHDFWGIGAYGRADTLVSTDMRAQMDDAITKKESIRMSGFVAQEVEKAAQDAGYDFDGVVKPAHDKDHYRIAYAEFVMPLVKAMQEQQIIIEEQNKKIELLIKEIQLIKINLNRSVSN